jgi:hypothetical protein
VALRGQAARPPRCGQRLAIPFSVVGQRESGQQHEISGNHAAGQSGLTGIPKLGQPRLGLGEARWRRDLDRAFKSFPMGDQEPGAASTSSDADFTIILNVRSFSSPSLCTDSGEAPPFRVVDFLSELGKSRSRLCDCRH